MVYADRRGLFLNGKAEAASGAPTCEKRVNTFSFCGTGGSLRKNGAKVILCPSFFGLKAKNRKKTASKQLPERFFYDIIIWQVQRRPHGQAVKTSPSHGENRGSSPRGATKKIAQAKACAIFLVFRRNCELRRGSRERSDAQPRGPLQGFRLIPLFPQAKPVLLSATPVFTGKSLCSLFGFPQKPRTPQGFARAQRRSTEELFIYRKQTPRTFHAGRFP